MGRLGTPFARLDARVGLAQAKLGCWRAQSTRDPIMLALRAGTNTRALITTTPRPLAVLRRTFTEATTVQTTDLTRFGSRQPGRRPSLGPATPPSRRGR
jgi:hypothetical protein